jgi:double-stranded uracil-DNA glycosylase
MASTRPRATPATIEPLKRSFPPVVDRRARLLVLGSLPGEESLRQARYYANPRNQFWRLMGAVIGRELEPLGYEERLTTLLDARVGLWDVVGSATRRGSLDAAIRDHAPNPLAELASELPGLRALAFNGSTAAGIGRKAIGETALTLLALPSSSPAYTLPFEAKREAWLELRRFL